MPDRSLGPRQGSLAAGTRPGAPGSATQKPDLRRLKSRVDLSSCAKDLTAADDPGISPALVANESLQAVVGEPLVKVEAYLHHIR